jgi:hypothetical protein
MKKKKVVGEKITANLYIITTKGQKQDFNLYIITASQPANQLSKIIANLYIITTNLTIRNKTSKLVNIAFGKKKKKALPLHANGQKPAIKK